MKVSSKKFKYIKVFFEILIVLTAISCAVGLVMMVTDFWSKNYSEYTSDVNIPIHTLINKVSAPSNAIKDAIVTSTKAKLTLQMKITPLVILTAFIFFFVTYFLIFGVLINLRRFFSGLTKGDPFTLENVISLKRSAIFMALIFPFNLIQILNDFWIVNSISKVYHLSMEPSLDVEVLFIAAILYTGAEILKFGIDIKKQSLDLQV